MTAGNCPVAGLWFVSGAESGCCRVDLFHGDVFAAAADRDDGGGGDDVGEGFEVAAGAPVQFDGMLAQGVLLRGRANLTDVSNSSAAAE